VKKKEVKRSQSPKDKGFYTTGSLKIEHKTN